MSRFRAEQNLVINFLKKYSKINIKHGYDHSIKNIIFTEKILANNFVVLNPNLISFKCLRHPNFSDNQDLIYFNELITFKNGKKFIKNTAIKNLKLKNKF